MALCALFFVFFCATGHLSAQPSSIAALQRSFEQPPDDARIMMRWWWFGPGVTKPELEGELRRMKEGGIGGFEVLKEVRRASPNVATPVIIVSVLSDSATRERCAAAGASAYVVKPVERNSLVATVKAQIAGRSKPKNGAK